MQVNNLEGREVFILGFGGMIVLTAIILLSIGAGHVITSRSNIPTEVRVSPTVAVNASAPKVEVNVPRAEMIPPTVEVRVPRADPPVINVQSSPAVVQLINRLAEGRLELTDEKKESVKPDVKKVSPVPATPESSPVQVVPAATPVKVETKASLDATLTVNDLYAQAESYIESYCKSRSIDPQAERMRWAAKWAAAVKQAADDNSSMDEQSYINRVVVDKRGCFDTDKATPEQVVEGCRLLLRYRDGQLAWQKDMREALTNAENLKKAVSFLQAGVR
jgi:hypothetical protein